MNDFIAKLRKPNLTWRVWKKIRSYFYQEQWILLLGKGLLDTSPEWEDFIRIPPPPDHIWADPFIWAKDGYYYIFFEEKSRNALRGYINCMTVDDALKVQKVEVALQQPYHLSYPFLFEYEGQLYMLPETGENRTVEVYKCIQFPTKWEKVKNLMSGVYAVDSTLLEASGKWWLFANIAEKVGPNWDSLHLFYADHPLSEHWTPHPYNPIVQDRRSARPAGRIFSDPRGLIRPSQDCSVRYGYAINFNRIDKLSETEYEESLISKFQPTTKNFLGTHTWNSADNVYVIDAKIPRSKF